MEFLLHDTKNKLPTPALSTKFSTLEVLTFEANKSHRIIKNGGSCPDLVSVIPSTECELELNCIHMMSITTFSKLATVAQKIFSLLND